MATQALIQINGVGGSNTDLPLNVTVNLTNVDAGGETSYEWTLLSQPEGAQDNFLDSGMLVSTLAAPQFTPNKEGSYLIRLIVNKGLVDEAQNQVIAAVLELQTGNRIPAALETTEVDPSSGWAYSAVNDILQRVTRLTDSGIFVANAGEALAPGDVVHMSEVVILANGLPGERRIPRVMKANAASLAEVDGPLGVMVGQVNGDYLPVALYDLCRVMSIGALSEISLAGGPGVAGDPVYVNDAGALSLAPGTYIRQVGDVAMVHPGPLYDVAIAAVANSIPRGNAGGDLAGFYPDPTVAKIGGSSGTSSEILRGNASGAPTWGTVPSAAFANYSIPILALQDMSQFVNLNGTYTNNTTSFTSVTGTVGAVFSRGNAIFRVMPQSDGDILDAYLTTASNNSSATAEIKYTITGPAGFAPETYVFRVRSAVAHNNNQITGTVAFYPVGFLAYIAGTYSVTVEARVLTAGDSITIVNPRLRLSQG